MHASHIAGTSCALHDVTIMKRPPYLLLTVLNQEIHLSSTLFDWLHSSGRSHQTKLWSKLLHLASCSSSTVRH